MLHSRITPVLLIDNGELYKTIKFKSPKYIGDPLNTVRIFNEKKVDELIILDITSTEQNRIPDWELISHISRECRMPLCYGGGIDSVEKVEKLVSLGVEKVAIGHTAYTNPNIIRKAISRVGRQSIVGVMDVKKTGLKREYKVFINRGRKNTNMNHIDYSKYLIDLGVGEVLLQNIDLDGVMEGFDNQLIKEVHNNIDVPLTVLGGAGKIEDLEGLISEFKIIGIAAGSLFIFKGRHKAVLVNYHNINKKLQNINIQNL